MVDRFASKTTGGVVTKLFELSRIILAKKGPAFTTYSDNQPGVLIQVFEVKRAMTKNSDLHDKFHLDGILPAPRGVL